MINRSEIIWLGIAAGVLGGMTGGVLLAIGLVLLDAGVHVGFLWLIMSLPASSFFGWLMARRLAKRGA